MRPITEPGDVAGIFVFAVSAAEADRLAASDPMVKAGLAVIERHPWIVAEGVLPTAFRAPLP